MNVALAFLDQHRARLDLDRYGIPARLSSLVITPRFQASGHVVFLLFAEGGRAPLLVAKVPRLVDATTSLAREAASLLAVQSLRPSGFASVPRLIGFEPFRGRPILVETALAGPLMEPGLARRDPERCSRLGLEWLLELQQSSARDSDAAWFETLVEAPLTGFAATFPLTAEETAMVEATRTIVEPLRKARLPFVCEHGDLSHPNLILMGRDSIGVVDWELARLDGMVGYDLFVFLTYLAFARQRAHTPDGHLAAFRDAFFGSGAWAARAAATYAGRAGIPLDLLNGLFVLCWARYTTTLLGRLNASDAAPAAAVPPDTAAWLRSNRYYHLWRDAVRNVQRLEWTS